MSDLGGNTEDKNSLTIIMLTCLCNVDPFNTVTPFVYGKIEVYRGIIFSYFYSKT